MKLAKKEEVRVPVRGRFFITEHHCAHCGAKVDAIDRYCRACGFELEDSTREELCYLADISATLQYFLLSCEDARQTHEQYEPEGLRTLLQMVENELNMISDRMKILKEKLDGKSIKS